MWTDDDWNRLARYMEARRGAMGYATFQAFIDDRDINYRTAWDAENAVAQNRTNIRRTTLDAIIDPAYGWVMGQGCRNILDRREPVAAAGTPGAAQPRRGGADLSEFTSQQQRAIKGIVKLLADSETAEGERSA
jgi:hypothetical protein